MNRRLAPPPIVLNVPWRLATPSSFCVAAGRILIDPAPGVARPLPAA